MLQQSSNPRDLLTDVDHHLDVLPTRPAADVPTGFPEQSDGCPAAGPPGGVKKRVIRQVVVLEVAGRLGDAVEDLGQAIELALADGPRGVVCDLSGVLEAAEPHAVDVLATAGRHARDWPGIPVAVACPDPRVHAVLAAHPLGGHLIVTTSMLRALRAVLATPTVAVEWLRLAPHPTAQSASRDFVARTLLDWRLSRVIRSAGSVVRELVTSSTMHAGTDIDLSVAWNLEALRLTVRDYSPGLPRQRYSTLGLHGRGLTVVAGLSKAFGVLPTTDGGKVVWAVLDAPGLGPSTSRRRRDLATEFRDTPMFTDARGLDRSLFCATSRLHLTGHRVPPPPGGASDR
jgi:hypothetical protein